MRSPVGKLGLSILMVRRVVVFSAVYASQVQAALAKPDASFAYVPPLIWLQVLFAWSLISASIPSFKAFMQPFDKIQERECMPNFTRTQKIGPHLLMGPHRSSIAASVPTNPRRSAKSQPSTEKSQMSIGRLRLDDVEAEVTITASPGTPKRRRSLESWGSQPGAILKDVGWEVTHHAPGSSLVSLKHSRVGLVTV